MEHKMVNGQMSEWCRVRFDSWCERIPNLWRYETSLTEIEAAYPLAMSALPSVILPCKKQSSYIPPVHIVYL